VDVSIDNHCEEDYGCTHIATFTMKNGEKVVYDLLCFRQLLPVYKHLGKTDCEDYRHLVASSVDDGDADIDLFD
jgi:hypothetical protein